MRFLLLVLASHFWSWSAADLGVYQVLFRSSIIGLCLGYLLFGDGLAWSWSLGLLSWSLSWSPSFGLIFITSCEIVNTTKTTYSTCVYMCVFVCWQSSVVQLDLFLLALQQTVQRQLSDTTAPLTTSVQTQHQLKYIAQYLSTLLQSAMAPVMLLTSLC